MNRKIKKNYKQKKINLNLKFRDIDAKLLNGWECLHSSSMQQKYFEQLKSQTQSAMNNQKFSIKLN